MTTVIYDSSWPTINVPTPEQAFDVSDWLAAYEAGDVTATDFIELYGVHPDANWSIVIGA
jgi:hypothetical protein